MPPTSRGLFFFHHYHNLRCPVLIFRRTKKGLVPHGSEGSWAETSTKTPYKVLPQKFKASPIQGRVKTSIKEGPETFGLRGGRGEEQGQGQARGQAQQPRSNRPKFPPGLGRLFWNVLIAVPVLGLAVSHIPFSVMTVTGGSMRPLFNPNKTTEAGDSGVETRDKMLVTLSGHWRNGDIERGEVVVFKTPHDPDKVAVKRVVALAGDRVLPLPGYVGSEDEQRDGVVIQFNHMWVEGDVDDRSKSVDSNWYGPISQNLVIGRASMLLSPWYNPSFIIASEHSWPAKEQKRVQYNAVEDAQKDPDYNSGAAFIDGTAEAALGRMQENKNGLAEQAVGESSRKKLIKVYQQARDEMRKNDPKTIELASELVKEIETAFYRAGGGIEYPVFPELKLVVAQEMRQEMAREKAKQNKMQEAKALYEQAQQKGLEEVAQRAGTTRA